MKPIDKFLQAIFLVMVFTAACSDSTEPPQDSTPPDISILLGIYPVSTGMCPEAATYYVNPRGSSDNASNLDDLRARWDFDNDGFWDTEFAEVISIQDYMPENIPTNSWSVTCEMKDSAGNSAIKTESIQTPDWMPIIPDIVSGEVWIIPEYTGPFVSVDTLTAGAGFSISLRRRDWVNDDTASVTQRYFIDDILVRESISPVQYPYPRLCTSSGFEVSDGISELGAHEIRVEAILNGGRIESDLENNSASRMVYIVE